jgi:hypothetical protein
VGFALLLIQAGGYFSFFRHGRLNLTNEEVMWLVKFFLEF